jgi:hypothetical protein
MDWISHCIKKDPGKLEGRATAGMLIILVVLSLLGWIYLTQASYVATTSRRIQELEAEKARLEQENLELMAEIAEFESVSRLATRAQELGFVAVVLDDAEFLAVADVPSIPRTERPRAPAEAPGVARWLDDVTAQFTAWVQAEAR